MIKIAKRTEDFNTHVIQSLKLEQELQKRVLFLAENPSPNNGDTHWHYFLLQNNLCSEETLNTQLAQHSNLDLVPKERLNLIDIAALRVFTKDDALRENILPLELSSKHFSFLCSAPLTTESLNTLEELVNCPIRIYITNQLRFSEAFQRIFAFPLSSFEKELLRSLELKKPKIEQTSLSLLVDSPQAQKVVAHPSKEKPEFSDTNKYAKISQKNVRDEHTRKDPRANTPTTIKKRKITLDEAILKLKLSKNRDQAVKILLQFAHEKLNCVAIFIAQKKQKEIFFKGWDLIHPTLQKEEFSKSIVVSHESHALNRIIHFKSAFLGPLSKKDALIKLFKDLPRSSLLLPVIFGSKLIAVLYGDNAKKSIHPSVLAELHILVPHFKEALKSIILQQKQSKNAPEDTLSNKIVTPKSNSLLPSPIKTLHSQSSGFPGISQNELTQEIAGFAEFELDGDETLNLSGFTLDSDELKEIIKQQPLTEELNPFDSKKTIDTAEENTILSSDDANLEAKKQSRIPVMKSPGRFATEESLQETYHSWLNYENDAVDAEIIELQQPGSRGRKARYVFSLKKEDALPSLARYFPGALSIDPFGNIESIPDVKDFSDAIGCLYNLGADLAAPILVEEISHPDRRHRYSAIWALSEIIIPAALPRLIRNIFDPEFRIALLALDVLHAYKEYSGYQEALIELRDLAIKNTQMHLKRRAILALSELQDTSSIPILIDLLSSPIQLIASDAHQALVKLCLQDFGSSKRKWNTWYQTHKELERTIWLIDSLAHKEQTIRRAAQFELNRYTGHYHDYQYYAPKQQREQAIIKWVKWWNVKQRRLEQIDLQQAAN